MAAPALSGKTLPAGFAASYIQVMADLIGPHGADAVLRRSGLSDWIGRPKVELDEARLDFALSSALLNGLGETLGPRGARGLARRMGGAAFDRVLRPAGAVAAMRDPGFQAFPVERRLRAGLYGLSRTLASMTSASVTSGEEPSGVGFRLEPCPDCWGRASNAPVCASMLGLLHAATAWIAPEVDAQIVEAECRAQEHAGCLFTIAWET